MALLTKVKARMAIHAHRKVRGLLEGSYASVQLGRSMDFFDLREYVAGDEVADIDWKASARRGEILVKRFVADRKHTILLVVSTSRTMAGMCDTQTSKRDVAVFAAGILGWLAVRHADWVTLVHGNAAGQQWLRPTTREDALERMLQAIWSGCTADAPAPDLAGLLAYVVKVVKRQAILVVIADDVDLDDAALAQLRRLRAQHEVLFMTVGDLDPTDPALAASALVDVGSGQAWPSYLRSPALHAEVVEERKTRHARRTKALDRLGIAGEHITDEADVIRSIFALLERHRHGG